jgi:hypothetical protein
MAVSVSKSVRGRPADCPTAWFAALERARLTHDRDLATKARAELRRLGVRVSFVRHDPRQEVAR